MNRLVTAAVVGGAALAVGVLPAIGLAAGTTMPTPIPVPAGPTSTQAPPATPAPPSDPAPPSTPAPPSKPGMPVHHKPVHRKPVHHKPVHKPVHRKPVHRKPTRKPAPTTQAAPRIIGGQNVTDAPWAAQISWDGTGFECSGTIVAPQWVLTAGHCANPDGMSVLIGSTQFGKGTAATVDKQEVDPDADLALLHLADPVRTTYMTLADKDPAVGDLNDIYGWGKTSTRSGPAPQLKTAKVKITSTGDCQDAAGGPAICSKAVTGAAFNGDSGGPELADGVEVGVCSTGDEHARTQEYGSVAANRDWIKQVAAV